MLRTLGGKNIGKCRLRAHQHPLLPPLSILLEPAPCNIQGKTRLQRVMERVLGDVLKMGCFVHRFLISGADLRIDARFCLFKPSFVHRFLISSPDLRIDAGFSPETPSSVHRFLISGPDLRIDAGFSPETPSSVHRFLISGPDLRIDARFSPETAQRLHRFLISYTDLRIDAAENSFACSSRCGSDLPRPILIFVAAKENGSACNGRDCYDVRFRF